MRVTLLASGAFALPALERLLSRGHEVAVGTQPARPAGRGRRLRPTPVAAFAADMGLSAEELDDVNAPESLAWLNATNPDTLVVIAFGQKLGPAVLASAPWGCINVHPSLLPRWRGAAPVPAAILGGDDITGVCVLDVVERMDAGDVLATARTPIGRKTSGELNDELAVTGADLLLDVLDALARGDATRTAQVESEVTRARKLKTDDGRIRWEHAVEDVDRRVRAVTPWPGAFTQLPDGTRLSVLSGEPMVRATGPLPGEVLDDPGLVVACGQGAYRLLRVQRQGKRPMDVEAFLRGVPLPPGTRLGP